MGGCIPIVYVSPEIVWTEKRRKVKGHAQTIFFGEQVYVILRIVWNLVNIAHTRLKPWGKGKLMIHLFPIIILNYVYWRAIHLMWPGIGHICPIIKRDYPTECPMLSAYSAFCVNPAVFRTSRSDSASLHGVWLTTPNTPQKVNTDQNAIDVLKWNLLKDGVIGYWDYQKHKQGMPHRKWRHGANNHCCEF